METDGRTDTISQFTAVDDAADPARLVELVDAFGLVPEIDRCRRVALDALRLQPGDVAVDLGCGPGDATVGMVPAVQPGGQVIGVDASETMVAEARRRTAGAGLPVSFEVGDAQALRFADDTFNGCRSERKLVHVPDAGGAVAEMVRVTRPGGRVVAIDVDAGGWLIDHPDRALTRTILMTFTDSLRNGWIGRQLVRLFTGAGLGDLSVDSIVVRVDLEVTELLLGGHLRRLQETGAVDAAAADQWHRDLAAAAGAGTFYCAMPVYVVAGTKPL